MSAHPPSYSSQKVEVSSLWILVILSNLVDRKYCIEVIPGLLRIDPKKPCNFYSSPLKCSFSGCSFLEYSLSKLSCHAGEIQATWRNHVYVFLLKSPAEPLADIQHQQPVMPTRVKQLGNLVWLGCSVTTISMLSDAII